MCETVSVTSSCKVHDGSALDVTFHTANAHYIGFDQRFALCRLERCSLDRFQKSTWRPTWGISLGQLTRSCPVLQVILKNYQPILLHICIVKCIYNAQGNINVKAVCRPRAIDTLAQHLRTVCRGILFDNSVKGPSDNNLKNAFLLISVSHLNSCVVS